MVRIVFLALFGALALAQVPEEGSDAALFGQHGGEAESDAALYGGQEQEEEASNQEGMEGSDNSKESDVALYAHNSGDFQAESDAALYSAALLQGAQKRQAPEAGSDLALFGGNGGESESDAALYGGQAQEEQASTQEEAGADNSRESDVALYAHNSGNYDADSDAALYGASFLQVQSGSSQTWQRAKTGKFTMNGQTIFAAPKKVDLNAKMPLKAQEQGFSGKKVQHVDAKTATGDWQSEYGPKVAPKKSGSVRCSTASAALIMSAVWFFSQ